MGSLPLLNHRVYRFINTNNRLWVTVSVRQCCKGPKDAPKPCKPNKPVSVADRTINLADNQNKYCVKPAQRSLVVRPKPCAAAPLRPPVTPPTVKPIKICRAEDMKKICPPKPCTCPPRKPPEKWTEKLKRLALFLLKAAVAGGVVYFTIEEGVWGDGDQAVEIYQNVLSNLMLIYPGAEVEAKQVKIPKTDKMAHQAKETWNKGVVVVCEFIGKTPGRLIGLVYKPKECNDGEPGSEGSEGSQGSEGAKGSKKAGGDSKARSVIDDRDPCEQEEEEC